MSGCGLDTSTSEEASSVGVEPLLVVVCCGVLPLLAVVCCGGSRYVGPHFVRADYSTSEEASGVGVEPRLVVE